MKFLVVVALVRVLLHPLEDVEMDITDYKTQFKSDKINVRI